MFSPYYYWNKRRDPDNHCAFNIALYGPRGARWAMTERGRDAVHRQRDAIAIGPSEMAWDGEALTIQLREIAAPWPRRVRGQIRVFPSSVNERTFTLETSGSHVWRPIAPLAHVEVDFDAPNLKWRGTGYFDANAGAEPLERGFSDWTWSRAALDDEAAILYDAHRRREGPLSLALRFDRSGLAQPFAPPPEVDLPATRWRMARRTRSESGQAEIARDFEDAPFYSRSLVNARWLGREVATMHESLSLERFAHPLVRCMLPFRMPRR